MSPSLIPRDSAAAGFSSTHECQAIFDTGSGSSSIHGELANSPAPKRDEGYTTSVKSPSPSSAGASKDGAAAGARSSVAAGATSTG